METKQRVSAPWKLGRRGPVCMADTSQAAAGRKPIRPLLSLYQLLYCWIWLLLVDTVRGRSIGESQESGGGCKTVVTILKARRRQASDIQASRGSGQQRLVHWIEKTSTMVWPNLVNLYCTVSLFADVMRRFALPSQWMSRDGNGWLMFSL